MATFTRAHELCKRLGDVPEYLQVMFWLVTASVVRGELPQAQEAIATLLRLAKARDDQPALLNAMRGRAMILLFMGQVVDAHAEIERAIEQFRREQRRREIGGAGGRPGRRSRGPGPYVVDPLAPRLRRQGARARIADALERAEAVEHPHTQAYVCYYASVLHALRGEFTIALQHAERCVRPVGRTRVRTVAEPRSRHQGYQHDYARPVIGRTLARRGAGRV